jgi:hypothetical protein
LQPLQTENQAQITSDSCNGICNDISECNDIDKNTVAENDENHVQKTACNYHNNNNGIFTGYTEDPLILVLFQTPAWQRHPNVLEPE